MGARHLGSRCSLVLLICTLLFIAAGFVQAAPPLQKAPSAVLTNPAGVPSGTAQLPDSPVILEFSSPGGYEGRTTPIIWRVVPGGEGTPIANVRLSDTTKNYYDGPYTISSGHNIILPAGTHTLTLTARNYKGNVTTRNLTVTILPDQPEIRSFTAATAPVIQGDTVTFSWDVVPGVRGEGAPIIDMTITDDQLQGVVWRGTGSSSTSAAVVMNFPGNRTFTLRVRNRLGHVSSKTVSVNVLKASDLMANISILNLEANPRYFQSGQPVDFQVVIRNGNSGIDIRPVNIYVTQAGRVVGTLSNLSIFQAVGSKPNNQVFTLRDSGSTATTNAAYTVDVEFRGLHKTRTFKTIPVTMYSIDPTTP